VRESEQIANVGHSGSSLFPHLHVQVMDAPTSRGEGVPSVFENFERLGGARPAPVRQGPIGTGEYVRAQR
jgi:murein DD-endopeptidase MepM/ murein hydrolase activator NlpD